MDLKAKKPSKKKGRGYHDHPDEHREIAYIKWDKFYQKEYKKPLTKSKAKLVHAMRPAKNQKIDNAKQAQTILKPNTFRANAYIKNPNRYDIEGIDSIKRKTPKQARNQYKKLKTSIDSTNRADSLNKLERELEVMYKKGYITENQFKKTKHSIHEKQYDLSSKKVDKDILLRRRRALSRSMNLKVAPDNEFKEIDDECRKLDRIYQRNPTQKNKEKLESSIKKLENFNKKYEKVGKTSKSSKKADVDELSNYANTQCKNNHLSTSYKSKLHKLITSGKVESKKDIDTEIHKEKLLLNAYDTWLSDEENDSLKKDILSGKITTYQEISKRNKKFKSNREEIYNTYKDYDVIPYYDENQKQKAILRLLGHERVSKKYKSIPDTTKEFAYQNRANVGYGGMIVEESHAMGVTERTKIGYSIERDSGYGKKDNQVSRIKVFDKDGIVKVTNKKGDESFYMLEYFVEAIKMADTDAKLYSGDESPLVIDTVQEEKPIIVLAPKTVNEDDDYVPFYPKDGFIFDYRQRS